MKTEQELLKAAVSKEMPDKDEILRCCILREEFYKENQSMRKKFAPRKIIVVCCVVIGLLAASTMAYAASGGTVSELADGTAVEEIKQKILDMTVTKDEDGSTHYDYEDDDTEFHGVVAPGYEDNIEVEKEVIDGEETVTITIKGDLDK